MLLSPTSPSSSTYLPDSPTCFTKYSPESDAAGIVVGQDLRDGGVGGVDLAVHAEHRDAGLFGPADVRDRAVGIRRIEQHGRVARGDHVLEVGRFLGRIVLRIEHDHVIAQLRRMLLGRFAQHDEPGVVQRRDDHGNPRLPAGLAGDPPPQPASTMSSRRTRRRERSSHERDSRTSGGRATGSQKTTPDFRITFAYGVHSPVRTITSLDRVSS